MLRLMRDNALLSPSRQPARRPTCSHDGKSVADAPNPIWGTNATASFTADDGPVTSCAASDYGTTACIGIPVVEGANR